MKSLKSISVLIFTLFIMSCASMSTVTNAPADAGVFRVFNEDHELVKAAVLASMQNLNINIKETNETPNGFAIMFTKPVSALSWGEVGRVLVVKYKNNKSKVFVHSEKRSKYQITGVDSQRFAHSIFSGVQEILKKG